MGDSERTAWLLAHNAQRKADAVKIRESYLLAEDALRECGRLLRTTEAGRYMWSADHKSAMTGLRVMVEALRYRIPDY